jgi:hypothetical protein
VPPILLGEGRVPREDLVRMIITNTRLARDVRGDLMAMIGAAHLGEKRLLSVLARYGADTTVAAVDAILALAEAHTRRIISTWADGTWLVRERHAHAWARAWVDGAWVDVDTTPPDWAQAEDGARPGGQRFRAWFTDTWSSLRYRYAVWQSESSEWEKWRLFGGIGLVVLAWLGWRVFGGARKKSTTRENIAESPIAREIAAGRDSPFYAVEAVIAAAGHGRAENESIRDWLVRIGRAGADQTAALKHLADLHYRYRFDPAGGSPEQRQALEQACAAWLAARQGSTVAA